MLGQAEPILIAGGRAADHSTEFFTGIDVAKTRNAFAIADGERGGEIRYPGEVDGFRLYVVPGACLLQTEASGFDRHMMRVVEPIAKPQSGARQRLKSCVSLPPVAGASGLSPFDEDIRQTIQLTEVGFNFKLGPTEQAVWAPMHPIFDQVGQATNAPRFYGGSDYLIWPGSKVSSTIGSRPTPPRLNRRNDLNSIRRYLKGARSDSTLRTVETGGERSKFW